MKTISIVVPCYNEEENVQAMADALRETFKKDLPAYRYEILFIDNDSKDRTREIIRKLCAEDKGIKGIFNAKNFGQFNSPYYAMLQNRGCHSTDGCRFSGSGRDDPKVCKRMGKRI